MAGTLATTKTARAKAAPDADAVTSTPKKRGRAMPRGHKGVYKSTSLVMRHLQKMQKAAEQRKKDALGKRGRSFVKVLEEAQSTDAAAMPRCVRLFPEEREDMEQKEEQPCEERAEQPERPTPKKYRVKKKASLKTPVHAAAPVEVVEEPLVLPDDVAADEELSLIHI